jgi:hypothetical protein
MKVQLQSGINQFDQNITISKSELFKCKLTQLGPAGAPGPALKRKNSGQ